MIGTPLQLSKLFDDEASLKYITSICFDDADFTATFKTICNRILRKCSAKSLMITSSLNKQIVELSNRAGKSLETFKTHLSEVQWIPLDHFLVDTDEAEKLSLEPYYDTKLF